MESTTVLVIIGSAVVAFGLLSRLVKRSSLSPALLALVTGVAVGPNVLDLLDPQAAVPRDELLVQLTRLALALAVFDIALRTRRRDLRENRTRLAVLLVVVMPGMWLSTALGAGLLLDLPLATVLLLGAVLTPTDPVVASALVTGLLPNRSLPRRVRMSLQLEAAANDGLALPFVLLAGSLIMLPASEAVADSAGEAAMQVGVAVAVGGVTGLIAERVTRIAGMAALAEEDWFPLASGGLAVAVLGLAHLLGGTGVLAAFVAGLVFSEGLPEDLREPIHVVHRSLAKVAQAVVFLAFGSVLPVDRWWPELGIVGVGFVFWTLLVRRIPVAVPALRLTGTGPRSSAFIAWSGPLGVAAIYYLAHAERFGVAAYERIFSAGTAAITLSVLVHAVTASRLVRVYRERGGGEAPEGTELRLEGPLP